MKILITGSTSSVAQALKLALTSSHEIITAGRKDCDITIDLNNEDAEIFFPAVDVVVHTAAQFGGKTFEEIFQTEKVNVLGTIKVCDAAIKANAKHVVLISSIFSTVPVGANQYNIYTLSKKHSEEVAQYYCSLHSLALTVLRPSQIFGNEEIFRKHQPFFYSIIDKAEKGDEILLFGSRKIYRNYIHINDVTSIIMKVIENRVEGIFSCQNLYDVNYAQIAEAAIKSFCSKSQISFLTDRPKVPDNIFEKDDLLYKRINFYPSISIEEGIQRIMLYRTAHK